jgi:hypothetical protein
MKFEDLAWGAFIYANLSKETQGEAKYNNLVSDGTYLRRLQQNPVLSDFEKLRDFLVHFGVHQARKGLPAEHLDIWPELKHHVEILRNQTLETVDLSDTQIQGAIKRAFSRLQWPNVWGGDTVASKVLHFFNVHLFMMWDSDIEMAYTKSYGPEGYFEFLEEMQSQAKEAIGNFNRLCLSGSPESFLSQRLGYQSIRPLTKFLGEYNWVTITKKWPSSPPDWLLNLYLQRRG